MIVSIHLEPVILHDASVTRLSRGPAKRQTTTESSIVHADGAAEWGGLC
jgi:hypothetical protein